MPSTIVGCSHSHVAQAAAQQKQSPQEHSALRRTADTANSNPTETTSLLQRDLSPPRKRQKSTFQALRDAVYGCCGVVKSKCDDTGPCYGVSQACGQECTRIIHQEPLIVALAEEGDRPHRHHHHHHHQLDQHEAHHHEGHQIAQTYSEPPTGHDDASSLEAGHASPQDDESSEQKRHHHHVPSNPFLTLGVQTSLAISLHKLPEGFITFAANHASPNLGLSVFMSLFIHNICEGLAMALPLYLALQSRARAMLYASILGGLSQPLGAAIAALCVSRSAELRARHGGDGDEAARGVTALTYGVLFSVTAGIMTYVGLQLYTEATSLTHNHSICVRAALAGMCLLGLGQALMK